jgi:hypothetical protein
VCVRARALLKKGRSQEGEGMSFLNRELSDDLLPFSGKLSERFYEVRQNVASFCEGKSLPVLPSLSVS